eukprot:6190378-Amphidinium_carterae.1
MKELLKSILKYLAFEGHHHPLLYFACVDATIGGYVFCARTVHTPFSVDCLLFPATDYPQPGVRLSVPLDDGVGAHFITETELFWKWLAAGEMQGLDVHHCVVGPTEQGCFVSCKIESLVRLDLPQIHEQQTQLQEVHRAMRLVRLPNTAVRRAKDTC